MTYQVVEFRTGFSIKNPSGNLISEDGHSFLAGDGRGEAKIFKSEAIASSVAEWLNSKRGGGLSKSQKREARKLLAIKSGLSEKQAIGFFQ